jgi:hypothetical protein
VISRVQGVTVVHPETVLLGMPTRRLPRVRPTQQCLTDDPKLPLDCSTDEFVLEIVLQCQFICVPDDEVA